MNRRIATSRTILVLIPMKHVVEITDVVRMIPIPLEIVNVGQVHAY